MELSFLVGSAKAIPEIIRQVESKLGFDLTDLTEHLADRRYSPYRVSVHAFIINVRSNAITNLAYGEIKIIFTRLVASTPL